MDSLQIKQATGMDNKRLINDMEKFKKHILGMSPKEFETMIKEKENGAGRVKNHTPMAYL